MPARAWRGRALRRPRSTAALLTISRRDLCDENGPQLQRDFVESGDAEEAIGAIGGEGEERLARCIFDRRGMLRGVVAHGADGGSGGVADLDAIALRLQLERILVLFVVADLHLVGVALHFPE